MEVINNDWKKDLSEDMIYELEELIKEDVKIGFLCNSEIQEDCILYLETNYFDDFINMNLTPEMFSDIVLEYRKKYQNPGTQENYKKLDAAFKCLEKRGIVTAHFAGFTTSDGWGIINRKIETYHSNSNKKIIGACFYIQQDLLHIFDDDIKELLFTFGSYSEQLTDQEIGEIIVEEFKKSGFDTSWNGSTDRKIAIINFIWDKQCEYE